MILYRSILLSEPKDSFVDIRHLSCSLYVVLENYYFLSTAKDLNKDKLSVPILYVFRNPTTTNREREDKQQNSTTGELIISRQEGYRQYPTRCRAAMPSLR